MPSDYKEIRRRDEDFYVKTIEAIGGLLSGQLYNEKSHFVYELLQNAEDALERRFQQNSDADFSCRVEFKLYPDRLEFRHFGELFNENDVKGISDVLKGTKGQDSKQIGTFGIGFKSVYAFTASPEIHSGDEHFVIKSYIRPEAKGADPALPIEGGETVFIFPFDHKDFPEEKAFKLILNKLRGLGARVLLFLRRIEEIKWSVEPDEEEGHYLKETQEVPNMRDAHRITVIEQKSGQDENENWLIFERTVTVPDDSGEVRVEVGFRLEAKTEDKEERVTKINDAPLVVYFPTEKATRLGFLVQGPYRTTPARDNILKDNGWNKTLIKETAELIVESLRQLKEMDLLSVSLLEALPIQTEDFQEDSMFYPIFSRVREALLGEALLPANDGTFVAAPNAKLARSEELRKLLNQNQLRALFQSNDEVKWLAEGITQNRTPALRSYLMNELGIGEVAPETFARNLSKEFLVEQTDEWFIRFYQFLSAQGELWRLPRRTWERGGILRSKPILRLQNESHVNPFRSNSSPTAYLATNTETSLPIVKVRLSSDEGAQKFLKELGIPALDIVEEVIEEILPKYTDTPATVDPEENERDLKKIECAYKTDSAEKKKRLRDALRKTPFILAECPNQGRRVYRKPGQVYFSNDELRMYFSGNDSFACVDADCPQSSMFRALGIKEHVRVWRKEADSKGHVLIKNYHGWHERGHEGFDPDIRVDGLEYALSPPTLEKSVFIWNEIARRNSDCVRGTVEESSRQTYENSRKKEQLSKEFGGLLISTAWLPDSDENLHKPNELTLDDLPESFVRDEKLADQLGMKKNVVAKLADEIGVKQETIQLAKKLEENPEKLEEIKRFLAQKEESQEHIFPTRAVSNSERRQEKFSEQHNAAPEKEYEIQERSVRSTRGKIYPETWLKNKYTNDADYQMSCQICKKEMPFRKRDGEYYFEAVEALSQKYFNKEHEAQFLALCPLCAARYKEFVKNDETATKELHYALKNLDELEVPLTLGEWETSLRFVETHRSDIMTILSKSPSP